MEVGVPPCIGQCVRCILVAGRSWAVLCSWTPGACRRHNPPLGPLPPPCSDPTALTQHERALCPPEMTWTVCTVQETSWRRWMKSQMTVKSGGEQLTKKNVSPIRIIQLECYLNKCSIHNVHISTIANTFINFSWKPLINVNIYNCFSECLFNKTRLPSTCSYCIHSPMHSCFWFHSHMYSVQSSFYPLTPGKEWRAVAAPLPKLLPG